MQAIIDKVRNGAAETRQKPANIPFFSLLPAERRSIRAEGVNTAALCGENQGQGIR